MVILLNKKNRNRNTLSQPIAINIFHLLFSVTYVRFPEIQYNSFLHRYYNDILILPQHTLLHQQTYLPFKKQISNIHLPSHMNRSKDNLYILLPVSIYKYTSQSFQRLLQSPFLFQSAMILLFLTAFLRKN